MKVCFIGVGRSGSAAAFTLQISGLAREIALVDRDADLAYKEALRLMHGASLTFCRKVYGGGREMIDGADIIAITHDIHRSASAEVGDRIESFKEVLDDIRKARLPQSAVLIVAANPIDILTQIAVEARILPPDQVMGLGTFLDTIWFRSLIAEHFSVDPSSVNALVLGEHGDFIVPVWSSAAINGVPIDSFPSYNIKKLKDIFKSAVKHWQDISASKDDDGWVFSLAVRELAASIVMDKQCVIPVSALQHGAFGINGLCLSLPTIVGRNGVQGVIEIKLNNEEIKSLKKCEETLRAKLAQIS